MYDLKDIRSIHLELTTRCQARCPMCPRRINGGPINPLFEITEIDLKTFKKWFPKSFIKQLQGINLCGNLGDPIIAKDCVKILEYIRSVNNSTTLNMHTNGSAKDVKWWIELAKLRIRVVFGIDGLEDTHHLYRIDTSFEKIIKNAKAFISAGGMAEWTMLVFEHNEHQIEQCRQMSADLGFSKFTIKHTSRFQNDRLNVIDDRGKTTHILYPTTKSKEMIPKIIESLKVEKPVIHCKVQHNKEFYIGATGAISPCCWLDFSWILPRHESRVDYMDRIDMLPTLRESTLEEIFNSGYFDKIESTWANKPLRECSRQCGSFDKLGEQFVQNN
jgi:MoaA/NifB/PqqE/SkfB family radical SAM enzyme